METNHKVRALSVACVAACLWIEGAPDAVLKLSMPNPRQPVVWGRDQHPANYVWLGLCHKQASQKHPPQAILAGGGLVYSTSLCFGVFWCFLVFFGCFLVFFGCFWATCCAHLPPRRIFSMVCWGLGGG